MREEENIAFYFKTLNALSHMIVQCEIGEIFYYDENWENYL